MFSFFKRTIVCFVDLIPSASFSRLLDTAISSGTRELCLFGSDPCIGMGQKQYQGFCWRSQSSDSCWERSRRWINFSSRCFTQSKR